MVLQVTAVAGSVPNWIVVAPATVLKLAPVMVTAIPPVTGPCHGETLATDGKIAYVYRFAEVAALVEPASVAVILTAPVPAGLITVHDVLAPAQKTPDPGVLPNFTVIDVSRPTPVNVTLWPPTVGPTDGLMWVIDGE